MSAEPEEEAADPRRFLTVGELRQAMQGLPDDAQVVVTDSPGHTYDLGVTEATVTRLIPWDHVCPDDGTHRPGLDCPEALGLDLWLSHGKAVRDD